MPISAKPRGATAAVAVLLTIGLNGSVVGGAADSAVFAILQRVDAMDEMATAMKAVPSQINSQAGFLAIADEASAIEKTGRGIPDMFPEGSEKGQTNAKPEIWQNWPEFEGRAAGLVRAAGKLRQAAAGSDPAIVIDQFHAVERACADCHVLFRRTK